MSEQDKAGRLLVDSGVIDAFQLQAALGHQRRWGCRLEDACVQLGFATEEQVLAAVARRLGVELVRIGDRMIDGAVLRRLPEKVQRTWNVFPVHLDTSVRPPVLRVAVEDPTNMALQDDLAFAAGCRLQLVLASHDDIANAIERHHGPRRAVS